MRASATTQSSPFFFDSNAASRAAGLPICLAALIAAIPFAFSQTPPAKPSVPAPVIDRALRLIREARQAFAGVSDYTFTLIKREQINGQQLPENVIAMTVRNEPFSVHMKWLKPKVLEGQEACYVAGRNNGMMRVKPAGLLGAMGFINLDVRDPRAQKMSRHSIAEAGIGNLIERYASRWEAERHSTRTRMRIGEFEFNQKRCLRVETVHPNSKPGDFYAYRSVIYFDKESHLPVRAELYDWPTADGPKDGAQIECFSFLDLQLNVGLGDEAFKY